MACDNRIEAQIDGLFEERSKLDLLVATHARVGSASGAVLLDEVVDHIELEALGKVPHVVRDANDIGGALRVHRIFDGAAAPAAGAESVRHPAKRQVHADDLVTRVDRARGSDGGVVPATHRCQNSHAYQSKRALTGDVVEGL